MKQSQSDMLAKTMETLREIIISEVNGKHAILKDIDECLSIIHFPIPSEVEVLDANLKEKNRIMKEIEELRFRRSQERIFRNGYNKAMQDMQEFLKDKERFDYGKITFDKV